MNNNLLKNQFVKTIVRTQIISQDSRKSAKSSIGRGLVGGFLLGPIGALGGALSGKNKNTVTFLIFYGDGSTETESVLIGSAQYNTYIKYLG